MELEEAVTNCDSPSVHSALLVISHIKLCLIVVVVIIVAVQLSASAAAAAAFFMASHALPRPSERPTTSAPTEPASVRLRFTGCLREVDTEHVH